MQIEGLSIRQRQIADRLWAIDTLEEVDEFIRELPPHLRLDAQLVKTLMIQAVVEEQIHDLRLANEALKPFVKHASN